MHPKWSSPLLLALAIASILLSACGDRGAPPANSNADGSPTGIRELDAVISAALSGDTSAILPYVEYTRTTCTTEQGLGGPPRCLVGEHDGTPVSVLPFLGSEGSFLREIDAPGWVAPPLTRLYAAYKVSDAAYSDPDYPAGEYALVFASGETSPSPVTLQVTQGRIVRIDYGAGWPPQIPAEAVLEYVATPQVGTP
ncbi:MAG TPA: hypothetical protein VFH29_06560 [Anaerolineales bacterium]|nr:hypothetical protein [Anaerolineales bacterium]